MIYTIIGIIFESLDSLLKGIKALLETREFTLGAIVAFIAPLAWAFNRIRNEKVRIIREQRVESRQLEIEQRQMRIESKIDDLLNHSGVESTWSLPVIGSSDMVRPKQKKLLLYLQMATKHPKRRERKMNTNINYMTLIPTILGAAKLILQTFGIDIPDETINEVVNGAAAVGTIVGIFLAHKRGDSIVKSPAITESNK